MTIATVPEKIRLRLRNIRLSRRISVRELATLCRIPPSSYSAIENGYYACNLQNLYQILDALGADISEVWPYAGLGDAMASNGLLYAIRKQDFRLAELVGILGAESGILCVENQKKVSILLTFGISQEMAVRIAGYIEIGGCLDEVFSEHVNGRSFHVVLDQIREMVHRPMVGYYLKVWSDAFTRDSKLLKAAKERQLQPGQ